MAYYWRASSLMQATRDSTRRWPWSTSPRSTTTRTTWSGGRQAGRPVASKSVRWRTLLDRVLARPGFARLLCYSLREALWLYAQGTSDDLVVGT